jgi:hypothetical protein
MTLNPEQFGEHQQQQLPLDWHASEADNRKEAVSNFKVMHSAIVPDPIRGEVVETKELGGGKHTKIHSILSRSGIPTNTLHDLAGEIHVEPIPDKTITPFGPPPSSVAGISVRAVGTTPKPVEVQINGSFNSLTDIIKLNSARPPDTDERFYRVSKTLNHELGHKLDYKKLGEHNDFKKIGFGHIPENRLPPGFRTSADPRKEGAADGFVDQHSGIPRSNFTHQLGDFYGRNPEWSPGERSIYHGTRAHLAKTGERFAVDAPIDKKDRMNPIGKHLHKLTNLSPHAEQSLRDVGLWDDAQSHINDYIKSRVNGTQLSFFGDADYDTHYFPVSHFRD